MIFAGIDPGLSGGIALLLDETEVHKMPSIDTIEELVELFLKIKATGNIKVVIEKQILKPHHIVRKCACGKVTSVPVMQAGVITNFTNYGRLLGIMAALQIPYEEIDAAKWKKYFKLTKDKKESIALAKQLFPALANTIKQKDGLAEALLIAEFGRRNL